MRVHNNFISEDLILKRRVKAFRNPGGSGAMELNIFQILAVAINLLRKLHIQFRRGEK